MEEDHLSILRLEFPLETIAELTAGTYNPETIIEHHLVDLSHYGKPEKNGNFDNTFGWLGSTVFDIDHILESIAFELVVEDLLNFRLTCRRWAFFGAKALQKILTFKFKLSAWQEDLDSNSNSNSMKLHLQQLIPVIGQSTEFICTAFKFYDTGALKVNPAAQSFFQNCGFCLKKLVLEGERSTAASSSIDEADFKKLIFGQVRNLEHLVLKTEITKQMIQTKLTASTGASRKRATEGKSSFVLNLKSLELKSKFPEDIFLEILKSNPCLVHIGLLHENHFYLKHLLSPHNRVCHLKKLQIHPTEHSIEMLEELIHDHYLGHLKLEEIQLTLVDAIKNVPAWPQRALAIIHHIFEASALSCEKLSWTQTVFLEGLEGLIPRMPKVTKLTLVCTYARGYGLICEDMEQYFPNKNQGLGEIFPNLKTVVIYSNLVSKNNIPITNLFGNVEPVLSVTKLLISSNWAKTDNERLWRNFRGIFPNAVLSPNKKVLKLYHGFWCC